MWLAIGLIATGLLCGVGGGRADDGVPDAEVAVEKLALLGLVNAPSDIVDADGVRRPVAELSGITWLGGTSYAAAMDGSDRLLILTISAAGEGVLPTVTYAGTVALDGRRDWEDVATLAGPDGRRRWFLVEEETPAVREFVTGAGATAIAGMPVAPLVAEGSVSLTVPFRSARPNRGPESLVLEPDGTRLWTANEEPLVRDGPAVAEGRAGRVRLVGLEVAPETAIGAASDPIGARREVIYEVDPPHARLGLPGGTLYSGVVALVALGQGRLIVLERSAAVGVPPLENRLYLVDTNGAAEARDIDGDLAAANVAPVAKRLLWQGALGVNLEGLCAGPPQPEGGVLIVGVADNAADDPASQRPNPFAFFLLTTP